MNAVEQHDDLLGGFPLLDQFPFGTFDPEESVASANAYRAFIIIEDLICRELTGQALLARLSLLQTFPRLLQSSRDPQKQSVTRGDDLSNFVHQYSAALCPRWYNKILSKLTPEEAEVFLKNYLTAHELWGHVRGITTLVKSMLENCAHQEIPVACQLLKPEERAIPTNMLSELKKSYSTLGVDFALGAKFLARPQVFEIRIGPITRRSLEKIQSLGWANGTDASAKLNELIGVASPFYLSSRTRILLAQTGFNLGGVPLGKSQLGYVDAEEQSAVIALLG